MKFVLEHILQTITFEKIAKVSTNKLWTLSYRLLKKVRLRNFRIEVAEQHSFKKFVEFRLQNGFLQFAEV
jgi:hypothetical protein